MIQRSITRRKGRGYQYSVEAFNSVRLLLHNSVSISKHHLLEHFGFFEAWKEVVEVLVIATASGLFVANGI